ncbi:MAG: hypothetical protein KDK70_31120 [Myxococcales bacterium]|nr:hypothetical protein [Myxococcales bacterium]
MLRVLGVMTLGLGLGCGPSTTGATDDGGDGDGGGSSGDGTSAASASSGAADSTADSSADSTGDSTGTDDTRPPPGELLPAESAISWGTCNEDGSMVIEVEAFVGLTFDGCIPPADAGIEGYLLIRIDPWDQLPRELEVGPDGPARVGYEAEEMYGTLRIDIWAPGHPTVITLDVAGETTELYGTIDLQACMQQLDSCIPMG